VSSSFITTSNSGTNRSAARRVRRSGKTGIPNGVNEAVRQDASKPRRFAPNAGATPRCHSGRLRDARYSAGNASRAARRRAPRADRVSSSSVVSAAILEQVNAGDGARGTA
jgi:hypothetical protein